MNSLQVNIYNFNELNTEAQEKALLNYLAINNNSNMTKKEIINNVFNNPDDTKYYFSANGDLISISNLDNLRNELYNIVEKYKLDLETEEW